ncbi:hypothetical protein EYD22_22210, partial [Klebsiella pneumoniae]
CCSEVSISPLFRWPNSVNHFKQNQPLRADGPGFVLRCTVHRLTTDCLPLPRCIALFRQCFHMNGLGNKLC